MNHAADLLHCVDISILEKNVLGEQTGVKLSKQRFRFFNFSYGRNPEKYCVLNYLQNENINFNIFVSKKKVVCKILVYHVCINLFNKSVPSNLYPAAMGGCVLPNYT